jgi:Prp8 binding protein
VHVFSLSAHAISYTLRGHADTITSLALSPTNSQLLSSSMDSVVHCWNVAPFAPQLNVSNPTLHPRLVRSYLGAPAGFEGLLRKACWSQHATQDGSGASMVAIGGADRTLTIWDATTANIIYKVRFRFVPGIGKMILMLNYLF